MATVDRRPRFPFPGKIAGWSRLDSDHCRQLWTLGRESGRTSRPQKARQFRRRLVLRNRSSFLERAGECIREATHGLCLKLHMNGLKVQLVHPPLQRSESLDRIDADGRLSSRDKFFECFARTSVYTVGRCFQMRKSFTIPRPVSTSRSSQAFRPAMRNLGQHSPWLHSKTLGGP